VTVIHQNTKVDISILQEMTVSLCKDFSIALAKFPKVRLGHFATPWSRWIGSANFLVVPAFGSNVTIAMGFRLAEIKPVNSNI